MYRALRLLTAAVLLGTVSTACGDGNGPSQGFVVSGTIQNNTGAAIPSNTRLIVAWVVSSSSPDYTYVFGHGTLNPSAGTFQIQLDQPPPAQALNAGSLGVGIILATTNQSITDGGDLSTVPEAELVGAAGQYGIIYVTDPGDAAQYRGWAPEFPAGYGLGVGVPVPGDFDRFDPVSATSAVLVIDDLQNIEFVNWT